jgi:plasmid replication initiation protein
MKEVIPSKDDYAIQSHCISRAAHDCPAYLKRLIFLAIAQVRPEDEGFMEMSMRVGDIARAIESAPEDMESGPRGKAYATIRSLAVDGLRRVVEIEMPNGDWKAFQWFSQLEYTKESDTLKIRLHDGLRPYITQVKGWASFSIRDIGRIQGRHAMRWYELAKSREGQADKKGFWFYDITFDELRHLFKIGPNEYPRTGNFRIKVIDDPIAEINEADIGLHLEADYEPYRKGRRLLGVHMKCRRIDRNEPRPVAAAKDTREEVAYKELPPERQARVDELAEMLKKQGELPLGQKPKSSFELHGEALKLEHEEHIAKNQKTKGRKAKVK